jgi:hypothetical protein
VHSTGVIEYQYPRVKNPLGRDVHWGDQTFEEMGIGFVRFRYLDETTAKPRVSETKTTATASLND